MGRSRSVIIVMISAALTVAAAGCRTVELENIRVTSGDDKAVVEASLSAKTGYEVAAEQNGSVLVLSLPGVKREPRVPKEQLIGRSRFLSGWFTGEREDALEVRLYLTGPLSFTHTASSGVGENGQPYNIRITISEKAETPPTGQAAAQTTESPKEPSRDSAVSHLARGIELFRAGGYDEALAELNAQVSVDERCPQAYFFAARIRLEKGQHERALSNLEAALRDSVDYSDAIGYLAYTLKKLGRESEAASAWRRFVTATGEPDAASVDTPADMNPLTWRERLAEYKRQREEEESDQRRRDAEKRELERREENRRETGAVARLNESETAADSAAAGEEPLTGSLADRPGGDTGGEDVGIGDIDRRIRTDIRRGFYGVLAAVVILSLGSAGVYVIWRRKTAGRAELTFAREVENLLHEREEHEDELDLWEDRTVREYRERRRVIEGESDAGTFSSEPLPETGPEPPPLPGEQFPERAQEPRPVSEERADRSDSPFDREPPPAWQPGFVEHNESRRLITEEVKALVTRMHKEGNSIEEICRASDLTKTEVELIIAVRARHMEQLIEEVQGDREDLDDIDHLYVAINELRAEGNTEREIARKLGVSTSEIAFVLAVTNSRPGGESLTGNMRGATCRRSSRKSKVNTGNYHGGNRIEKGEGDVLA